MNKRSLLIGTATLFILGACGKEEAKNADSANNKSAELVAGENELLIDVDGEQKIVDASPYIIDDTIDVKLTNDFKIDRYENGDIMTGTGDLEGIYLTAVAKEDSFGIEKKDQPVGYDELEATSEGGHDVEYIDLTKYPD